MSLCLCLLKLKIKLFSITIKCCNTKKEVGLLIIIKKISVNLKVAETKGSLKNS